MDELSCTPEQTRAIFIAGKMAGVAMSLPIEQLQSYLDSKPEGFVYSAMCQKAIDFARSVQGYTK